MSQFADHCSTFKSKLIEHKDNYKIVIDVFVDTITNQEWETDSIVSILSSGLGISEEIDIAINKEIEREKSY